MRRVIILTALSSVLTCPASLSFAAVTPVDLNSPGDELLTRDLDNDLDLPETMNSDSPANNRTFNDISSQLGPGGEFEGFHHATEADLIAMLISAGVPDINAGGTAANHTPLADLISLLGATEPNGSLSQGLLADSNSPDTHQFAALEPVNAVTARVNTARGDIMDDQSDLNGGHFLVRQVPEPATSPSPPWGLLAWLPSGGGGGNADAGPSERSPIRLARPFPEFCFQTGPLPKPV